MIQATRLEQLLALFLYQRQYLQIPDLGTFRLHDFKPFPNDRNPVLIPQDKISFIQNAREPIDPELIAYVTSQTNKMESLATADIRTLSNQAREMLNIRQPFKFPGIGTLQMNAQGTIGLSPGTVIGDSPEVSAVRPKAKTGFISPSGKRKNIRKRLLITLTTIMALIAIAVIAYLFLYPEESNFIKLKQNTTDQNPSLPTATANDAAEDINHTTRELSGDSIRYQIVFETSRQDRAFYRYNELTSWGHHILMKTKDSITYTLAVPFATALRDTTAMKDSISALYGREVYIRYEYRKAASP